MPDIILKALLLARTEIHTEITGCCCLNHDEREQARERLEIIDAAIAEFNHNLPIDQKLLAENMDRV